MNTSSAAGLSYMHNIGKEPLRGLTLGNLLEIAAKKFPNREAVVSIYQQHRMTYSELLEQADKLASSLQTIGLEKGDRIAIWSSNTSEWVVTKMASARAGFVLVTLNPTYQGPELKFSLNQVGAKAIICPEKVKKINFLKILEEILPEMENCVPSQRMVSKDVPSLIYVVVISERIIKGAFNYNDLIKFTTENSIKNIRNNQHTIKLDDPCNIQFTSGTTGQPKAASLSHFSLVNNSYVIGKRIELDTSHQKICVQVPFFHVYGVGTIGMALHFGSTIVIPSPTYSPTANVQAIKEERCTVIHGTPTMYVDMVSILKEKDFDINPKIAVSGGAPCSPILFKQMKKYLKVEKVKSVYGLTEATAVVFQSLPIEEDEYKSTATVGYIGDHLEVKVVDPQNNLVPLGEPGELCVRGYSRMLGYWENEEETKKIISNDGWLRTGDQFVLQEDGYGRIVGRLKDMIIRGGENIFPKEIEDFLLTHPDILEVYIVGLSHERFGEEVCACIRLSEGAYLSHESLVEFCKGKLSHFKIPSQLRIMASFPKTVSGKIKKHVLRENLEQLRGKSNSEQYLSSLLN